MSEQPPTLEIDQALFGYSDGHRQLAASLSLSSRDMYELAARSDLAPGASMASDDSYLTSVTLPESRIVALIKTWPAPEMPRPGCVWSHVLLIPKKVLSTQVDLGVLRDLFSRPAGPQDRTRFEHRLSVRRFAKSPPGEPSTIARLIASYYGDRQVTVGALPDDAFERAIFGVWSQQWPRLRTDFQIRTLLGPASSSDRGLVIRVSPQLVDDQMSLQDDVDQPWIRSAVADAVASSITPLRRFLWRYGKDVSRPRSAFRPLVELFLETEFDRASLTYEQVVSTIKRFGPKADATTLKRDILGASSSALALAPKIRAQDFFRLIADWPIFEDGLLSREEFRQAVMRSTTSELTEMAVGFLALGDEQASPEIDEARDAIVEAIDADAFNAPDFPYAFLIAALRRRPVLSGTVDMGRLEPADAAALLLTEERAAVGPLLRRVLAGHATDVAVRAVERRLAIAFGEAVQVSPAGALDPSWARLFARMSDRILDQGLDAAIRGASATARAIELLDYPLSALLPAAKWHDVAGDGSSEPDRDPSRAIVDGYLVALCLGEGVDRNIAVLASVMPRLRAMALTDGLPPRVRQLLDRSLPYARESWDLNRRLLKVLRRARQDRIDVVPIIERLDLSQSELAYVMGEDDDSGFSFLMPRIWPFRP